MLITHQEKRGIPVIIINGRVDATTIPQISEYLKPILDYVKSKNEIRGLIFDMSKIVFIDSGGIALFCGRFVSLKREGKKMYLCNPQHRVWNFFVEVGLSDVFSVYDDIFAALGDLS